MKNKLEITEFYNGIVSDVKYKVHDAYTVYLVTSNKAVAENVWQHLKNEYNEEHKNAS